jgi:hypothetical protein
MGDKPVVTAAGLLQSSVVMMEGTLLNKIEEYE